VSWRRSIRPPRQDQREAPEQFLIALGFLRHDALANREGERSIRSLCTRTA